MSHCLALLFFQPCVNVVRERHLAISTGNHSHPRHGGNLAALQLCVTPGDHNRSLGIKLRKPVNSLPAFLVGHLCHTARVDDDYVRCLPGMDASYAAFAEYVGNR